MMKLVLGALALTLLPLAAAHAQSYPTKPIRLVVGFGVSRVFYRDPAAAAARGAGNERRKHSVVSPGDMGQAVAGRLKESGYAVHTALEGRSARTRSLAAKAGLQDAGSMNELVSRCDMVWSILNPAAAVDKARETAAAMKATGRRITYVDCNAVSPDTVREIDTVIVGAGGTFADAGIIGAPPRGAAKTRVYVSGKDAERITAIRNDHLIIRVVSDRVGDASALIESIAATELGRESPEQARDPRAVIRDLAAGI